MSILTKRFPSQSTGQVCCPVKIKSTKETKDTQHNRYHYRTGQCNVYLDNIVVNIVNESLPFVSVGSASFR